MKTWERILHFLSLAFVVLSLFGALFVSASSQFILDDLFFPFGVLFLVYSFFKEPKWRWLILAFGAMSAWGMMSDILANSGIRTQPMGMLIRWIKWPIILITVADLHKVNIKKNLVENGVVVAFLLLAGINILMMLNPVGFGRYLHEIYNPKIEVLLSNYHEFGAFRLSGTMLNPNNNAILFGLFLLFFLHIDPRKYWKYIVLAFVLIFLTQSRTTLLITLLIVGLYILRYNSRKTNLILIPGGILALTAGLFFFRSTNLMSIVDGSAFKSASWTDRVEHYGILFTSGLRELILGHGVVLDPIAAVGFHFDSEYLSLGYQYGLIGLFIWLSIIGISFFLIQRANRKSTFSWALVLFILGIASTNFTFLNVECATLMMSLVGAWLFLQSKNELDHHSEEKTEEKPV
jgi:hypothetical protein